MRLVRLLKRDLAREVSDWAGEGLISTPQAERICARYGVDYYHQESHSFGYYVLVGLGYLFIGLAVITLLSANWEQIPRAVRMLGLIGVSGGTMGAVNALNSLRAVGRSLHAWVIPQQVTIPQGWKLFNEDGELQDEQTRERLLEVGRQVARFAFLHSSHEVQEFLKLWEQAPPNPGG